MIAMSAHAIVREPTVNQDVLESVVEEMRHLGIGHVTMQIERQEMCAEGHP
jgi:Co/Zn/Cd efflux system component